MTPIIVNSLRVALFEPQIPPNTGNIARTCSAFNLHLSLIKPLGFSLDDRYLKRAGLDYWPSVSMETYEDFGDFKSSLSSSARIVGCSKVGGPTITSTVFTMHDVLLFGREDIGLPTEIRNQCNIITTIPMPGGSITTGDNKVRSLNLSSAVAIIAHEACSQLCFW